MVEPVIVARHDTAALENELGNPITIVEDHGEILRLKPELEQFKRVHRIKPSFALVGSPDKTECLRR